METSLRFFIEPAKWTKINYTCMGSLVFCILIVVDKEICTVVLPTLWCFSLAFSLLPMWFANTYPGTRILLRAGWIGFFYSEQKCVSNLDPYLISGIRLVSKQMIVWSQIVSCWLCMFYYFIYKQTILKNDLIYIYVFVHFDRDAGLICLYYADCLIGEVTWRTASTFLKALWCSLK